MVMKISLAFFSARNVAKMTTPRVPKEPLVAIMGTTGTGKSDLAVDLAVKFNGEIINADAMQMYDGLPVITNQISLEEQRGIPHHLLATIKLDQPTWTVANFSREAGKLIREIRSRGKLPIVVGGTHYYVNSLLFENSLVVSQDADEIDQHASPEVVQKHPMLDGPTDLMLKRLREVDPVMGSRWHPDDRRKIRRSLEIFLTTGRKASDIYAEQEKMKENGNLDSPWDALMFWVYSKRDVLVKRLDNRADKMEKIGLMEEVRQLHEQLRTRTAAGEEVDRCSGIWQSIGFKQLEKFLDAEREGADQGLLDKLKNSSLEEMKAATRQYARSQLKFIRNKTLPELKEKGVTQFFYLLDSSHPERFSDDVLSPAENITRHFLGGQELPHPRDISETANEVLTACIKNAQKKVFQTRTCDICEVTLISEEEYDRHTKSKRHRRGLKHKSRTALVVVGDTETIKGSDPPTANVGKVPDGIHTSSIESGEG